MIQSFMGKVFGTSNDRELKKYSTKIKNINALENKYEKLSDDELKASFEKLKQNVFEDKSTLDDVLEDSFAITREASKRVLGMRHFDVQLIGGIALHEGRIAEMKTGEGKTLVATLAIVLNAMKSRGVHLVTVNDYLASRDAKEMGVLYNFLGYSVGTILENINDPQEKIDAYKADITYGTNNEFGFDYLRDNMSYSADQMAQNGHNFVIVDEVDSILIDEARTPLIISGPTNRNMQDYVKANYLFEKDVDYVVNNGEVVIVDEFTGRLSEGRRFSEGLHQALEAKEEVEIKEETQTLADITFQNYFRMYDKLAGMTGTAETEATEFAQIYNLDVVSIPTNIPITRKDLNDLIYKTEEEKFIAVIETIKKLSITGQPILIGTASIEKSELLHNVLKKEKIAHTVLNAKNHEQEGEIIKNAGVKGAVTIATNMAGRGVDIKVNDEVIALGGLYIIGTERHENRRIDNQLRGRSGRQGDAGTTQFYLSLEDNLLRIFGSDKIKSIMERLGVEDGEYIESKMVTRAVEKAQKKVENMHYEGRKQIVEYDDVANEQRKIVYKFRNQLLSKEYDIVSKINEIREEYIAHLLQKSDAYEGGDKEDFSLTKLQEFLKEETNFDLDIDKLINLEYEDLFTSVLNQLKESYDEKMSVLERDVQTEIEKEFYLKELDNAWREHLYAMDNMKTGIRLRAYNQKDPLVEYKKESFNLFGELINDIKFNTIRTLQVIQFQMESAEEEASRVAQQLKMQQEQNAALMKLNHSSIEETIVSEKKIARNDPCPCGSGKKYKQCCGKSGPKKGVFAGKGAFAS